jgi:hypothetical protein
MSLHTLRKRQASLIFIVDGFLWQVALSFHKIVADVLGLKLSRAEQEEQQPLMQAEILRSPATTAVTDAHSPASSHVPPGTSKSAVCEIQ